LYRYGLYHFEPYLQVYLGGIEAYKSILVAYRLTSLSWWHRGLYIFDASIDPILTVSRGLSILGALIFVYLVCIDCLYAVKICLS